MISWGKSFTPSSLLSFHSWNETRRKWPIFLESGEEGVIARGCVWRKSVGGSTPLPQNVCGCLIWFRRRACESVWILYSFGIDSHANVHACVLLSKKTWEETGFHGHLALTWNSLVPVTHAPECTGAVLCVSPASPQMIDLISFCCLNSIFSFPAFWKMKNLEESHWNSTASAHTPFTCVRQFLASCHIAHTSSFLSIDNVNVHV